MLNVIPDSDCNILRTEPCCLVGLLFISDIIIKVNDLKDNFIE